MKQDVKKPKCGIIMPISGVEEKHAYASIYTARHWLDVKQIIIECATEIKFECNIVSESDIAGGIILKDIIHNLYNNEIVVCDISNTNPNVMFELGMRLSFTKPTIVIKDNLTPTPFDTSSIRYLEYPHNLDFYGIKDFQAKLQDSIKILNKELENGKYIPFLKTFKDISYNPTNLETEEVDSTEYIISTLNDTIKQTIKQEFQNRSIIPIQSIAASTLQNSTYPMTITPSTHGESIIANALNNNSNNPILGFNNFGKK